MRLQQKVAIITGGSGGIGQATVRRFLQEGATVAIVDYDEQALHQWATQLRTEHLESFETYVLDVSSLDHVQKVIAQIAERFGTIDILVNNAGITQDAQLTKMTAEQFQHVFEVNTTGVFYCTQQVVPHMIAQQSGKIINTTSVSGVHGNFGQTNYAASKAAVIGMTETWAKELGRHNINVNAVAPGFTLTPMVKKMPDAVIEKMTKMIPLGRLGKPEDIANAYVFLASDEASYIHGHTLHVDGAIIM